MTSPTNGNEHGKYIMFVLGACIDFRTSSLKGRSRKDDGIEFANRGPLASSRLSQLTLRVSDEACCAETEGLGSSLNAGR